jgi:hypothetical protein
MSASLLQQPTQYFLGLARTFDLIHINQPAAQQVRRQARRRATELEGTAAHADKTSI